VRPITLIAQIQTIISKFNNLKERNEILKKETRNLNITSNCLECFGSNLKITQTRKSKNKSYTKRTAICKDCNAVNTQIINTVNSKLVKGTVSITCSPILHQLTDNMAIKIKNGVVDVIDPMLTKDGYKQTMIQKLIFTKPFRKRSIAKHQSLYDKGVYDKAINSIEPVLIRYEYHHKKFPMDEAIISLLNKENNKIIDKKNYLKNKTVKETRCVEAYWSKNLSDNSDSIYFKTVKGVFTL